MNDYPRRMQIIYAAILSLILLLFFFHMSWGWRLIGCSLVVIVAGLLFWRLIRYRKQLRASTANMAFLSQKLDLLPARQRYRLPILLVSGNAAKELFPSDLSLAESNVVVSSEAVWIYVEHHSELPIVFDTLVARWPDMLGRIGLLLAVAPEAEDKLGLFVAKLQAFRQSWVDTCRIAKYRLPVYLTTHIGLNDIHYNELAPIPSYWYQLLDGKLYLLDEFLSPLDNWVYDKKISSSERQQRLHLQAALWESAKWVERVILPVLVDDKQPIAKCIPEASALYPLSSQQQADNIFDKNWLSLTSLSMPCTQHIHDVISPPDKLVKFMPMAYPFSPMCKTVCGLLIISSLFGAGCLAASYLNNQKLIQQIDNDIAHYDLIAMDSYDEKAQALLVIKADRDLLNQYFKQGEPVRLGFGLYRGDALLEPINQAIGRYVPQPPPPPPPPEPEKIIITQKEIVIKEPEVIRMDSLSLFASGQSTLKVESTKVLINALFEMKNQINANNDTGWLVLITGHTDSVGDAVKNQQLSLARAAAVRDWIISTSDIPETCFAVQGYGAKKPLVSNDTPEDRAQNRRVEISLVPQISTCRLSDEN